MEPVSLGQVEDDLLLLFLYYITIYGNGYHILSLPDDLISFPLSF